MLRKLEELAARPRTQPPYRKMTGATTPPVAPTAVHGVGAVHDHAVAAVLIVGLHADAGPTVHAIHVMKKTRLSRTHLFGPLLLKSRVTPEP